ncbi:MAG: Bax inhibitor-1/YccA family protein [Vitreimonas sp.]
MSDYHPQARSVPAGQADMAVDAGLRSFMLGIYNKMALGLLLSAALAYASVTVEPIAQFVFGTPFYFVVLFGPLAILLVSSFVMRNPSPMAANIVYWSVVSLMGISLGAILMSYARAPDGIATVAKAFLTTAVSFGALSLWGYTTKRDLTGFGTFLMMGLFGLIAAMLVNVGFAAFTGHEITGLSLAISVIGVLVFAGLTAYDTQALKFSYYQLGGNARGMAVATTYGALRLYLDFINLFLFILRLMGGRR